MGACFVFDVRCEYLDALSIKEASFVIDVRFESLEALHFKGACFVIDFRCESLEATIFMGVSCLIEFFLRQGCSMLVFRNGTIVEQSMTVIHHMLGRIQTQTP